MIRSNITASKANFSFCSLYVCIVLSLSLSHWSVYGGSQYTVVLSNVFFFFILAHFTVYHSSSFVLLLYNLLYPQNTATLYLFLLHSDVLYIFFLKLTHSLLFSLLLNLTLSLFLTLCTYIQCVVECLSCIFGFSQACTFDTIIKLPWYVVNYTNDDAYIHT